MDLVEGRMQPEDWLAWWAAHASEVEVACPRGWFLKLKPMGANSDVNGATLHSQQGACSVLQSLKVPFVASDRYHKAWQEDFQRFRAAEDARRKLRAKESAPRLTALADAFPKFARFLKKRASDIDTLQDPASAEEIAAIEVSVGMPLSGAYKQFLQCTRGLRYDCLAVGLDQVYRHPAFIGEQPHAREAICIAEFSLEADGDQVLLEYNSQPVDDAPVYYYAHSTGTVRELASSLTAWLESLPRSAAFRK
jgi:hypothetical protein